ncbi:hypothetical protein ACE6H2_015388 [Prunus campanulata]
MAARVLKLRGSSTNNMSCAALTAEPNLTIGALVMAPIDAGHQGTLRRPLQGLASDRRLSPAVPKFQRLLVRHRRSGQHRLEDLAVNRKS